MLALAQLAAHVVAQRFDLGMRVSAALSTSSSRCGAALQVEPENDRAHRQKARQRLLQRADRRRRSGSSARAATCAMKVTARIEMTFQGARRSMVFKVSVRERSARRWAPSLYLEGASLTGSPLARTSVIPMRAIAHAHVRRDLDLHLAVVGRLGDLADQAARGDDRVAAPRALASSRAVPWRAAAADAG